MTTTVDTTSVLEDYRRAQDGFDAVVAAVPAPAWDRPSTCPGWTARDVLGHVVWGQDLVRHLAVGAEFTDMTGAPGSERPSVLVAGDPVRTWRAARRTSVSALDADSLDRVVSLRAFGEIPLAGFVRALVTDFLAHTWDIGEGAGIEVRLDPALLPGSWQWSRTHAVRRPGGIGPALEAPPDADEQARLLAFLGRRAA